MPVFERVVRCRSCYLYTLKPRRWRWLAILTGSMWALLVLDDHVWVLPEDRANELLRDYRNWLGENRLGG